MMDGAISRRNSERKKAQDGEALVNVACAHFDASSNERQETMQLMIQMSDVASVEMDKWETLVATCYEN